MTTLTTKDYVLQMKTSLQLQRTINIRKTLIKLFTVVSKVSSFMGNPVCRIEMFLKFGEINIYSAWKFF